MVISFKTNRQTGIIWINSLLNSSSELWCSRCDYLTKSDKNISIWVLLRHLLVHFAWHKSNFFGLIENIITDLNSLDKITIEMQKIWPQNMLDEHFYLSVAMVPYKITWHAYWFSIKKFKIIYFTLHSLTSPQINFEKSQVAIPVHWVVPSKYITSFTLLSLNQKTAWLYDLPKNYDYCVGLFQWAFSTC